MTKTEQVLETFITPPLDMLRENVLKRVGEMNVQLDKFIYQSKVDAHLNEQQATLMFLLLKIAEVKEDVRMLWDNIPGVVI